MISKNNLRYRKRPRKATKSDCNGCEDDFYNGHNDLGIEACMRLESAMLVLRKKVPLDQCPPWTQEPIRVPNCYRQKGFVFIGANRDK